MNKKHLFIFCLLWTLGIMANAEEIPNDEIWYTANSKLKETTETYTHALHTDAFSVTISSHTFSDGKGVIKFSGDITNIGGHAFYGCSSLTSVTIPNSVTSIGDGAFSECTSLPIADNLRYADTYLVGPVDKTLSTSTIKEGTKWIGESAFNGCTSLTSITIPNSVTSIGSYAFSECTPKEVNVKIIDFSNNNIIPNCLSSSAWHYYYDESKIAGKFILPSNVSALGSRALYKCTDVTSVTIPNSVKSIGERAFEGCLGLTSVTIPNTIKSIGSYAFNGCSNLSKVDISDINSWLNISIGNNTANPIYYAKGLYVNGELLTKLNVPNEITKIKPYAFYNCVGLTSIYVPTTVTSIGQCAFAGCSNVESLYVGWNMPIKNVNANSFYDYDGIYLTTLYVPKGTSKKYELVNVWKNFYNIVEDDEVNSIDGSLIATSPNSTTSKEELYNLAGQVISEDYKGIIIHNGRKYLKR